MEIELFYLIDCMLVQDQFKNASGMLCEFTYLYLELGFIFKSTIYKGVKERKLPDKLIYKFN